MKTRDLSIMRRKEIRFKAIDPFTGQQLEKVGQVVADEKTDLNLIPSMDRLQIERMFRAEGMDRFPSKGMIVKIAGLYGPQWHLVYENEILSIEK